ncbi:TPA: ParB/RepB/Spo0J family partition protein [Burkholderia cenocepacia]|uniref:ParB N-terminal domain-containing protein n=1 Tax=Burkholderia vietnamiensis TaxID=60552 RepID=A0ABS1AXF2_BURVI|nr:ParB/RepB/Spo0J family partition protein [Burkholderia vietnamiensis]MBJ9688806.1 ParB N-terminal domain-containing protein [Burkholderia vietnamiensis]
MKSQVSNAPTAAIGAGKPVITVPFGQLTNSPYNVRRKEPTNIEAMAQSIRAAGAVLQNLIVHAIEQDGQAEPLYGVCAGRRRQGGLGLLYSNSEITLDFPVPVIVVSDTEARIVSLMENAEREDMALADVYEAIRDLHADGVSIDTIAEMFSLSRVTVERRLKLANLSPVLFAEFREDKIELAQMQALALTDDHAEQERVWAEAQKGQNWMRTPRYLREAITREELNAQENPLAIFVGLAVYEAAGGYVRRDLFAEDGSGYITDAALLTRLASEKLEEQAAAVTAEGWSWTETMLEFDHNVVFQYGRVHSTERKPTRAEAKTRKALVQALDAATLTYEDADEEASNLDELEHAVEAAQAQLDAFDETLVVWADADKSKAGAVIGIDDDGQVHIERGLVKRENLSTSTQANGHVSTTDSGAPKTRPVHSDKLCRQLSAHKTAAIAVELAKRPDIAVAALLARMIPAVFDEIYFHSYGHGMGIDVAARNHHDKLLSDAADMADSPAWAQIDADRKKWGALLPRRMGDLLGWLLTQDADTVSHLFAFCVGATLDGIQSRQGPHSINALADVLQLDMTQYWNASAARYFDHVSKARTVEVVKEVAGAESAALYEKMKKGEAASAAERAVADTGWLPEILTSRELPGNQAWQGGDDEEETEDEEMADEAEE